MFMCRHNKKCTPDELGAYESDIVILASKKKNKKQEIVVLTIFLRAM